jgi:hypothetical protein
MRIKFLSALTGFFFVIFTVTACLGDPEEYTYSTDDTIHAFALDTVFGVDYKFTIDQHRALIYNVDSMPVHADTVINNILITTLTVAGYATSGDTIMDLSDSIDLSQTMVGLGGEPMKIRVHAADGIHTKEYSIEVRRHLQDPDSLVWKQMTASFSGGSVTGAHKTVYLNGQILTFTDYQTVYSTVATEGIQWAKQTLTGLPANIILSSILASGEVLYAVTDDGLLFKSDANGYTWGVMNTNEAKVQTLIASLHNGISGVVEEAGTRYFAMGTPAENTMEWTRENVVPATFPRKKITSTHYVTATGLDKYLSIGPAAQNDTITYAWFTYDGQSWADLSTASVYHLPAMENPTVLHYAGSIYAFGDTLSTFYSSIDGIIWNAVERKVMFPESFTEAAHYSFTIDADNYLWIVLTDPDEVWRGRVNRYGFLKP